MARRGLTTRAAILGLVVCALVVALAVPLQEYLSQHSQITALQRTEAQQQHRVSALARQQQQLQDPAVTARQARERLHFVLPGETAFIVVAPPPGRPPAAAASTTRQDPTHPWYSQLWDSVVAAGR